MKLNRYLLLLILGYIFTLGAAEEYDEDIVSEQAEQSCKEDE